MDWRRWKQESKAGPPTGAVGGQANRSAAAGVPGGVLGPGGTVPERSVPRRGPPGPPALLPCPVPPAAALV